MNEQRNTRKKDVVDTRQIKTNLDFGTGLLWIMDRRMRGMLISIFTDLKVVFSNVTEIIFGLGSIRQVFI